VQKSTVTPARYTIITSKIDENCCLLGKLAGFLWLLSFVPHTRDRGDALVLLDGLDPNGAASAQCFDEQDRALYIGDQRRAKVDRAAPEQVAARDLVFACRALFTSGE
jgi:hypothetical protein